MTVEVNPSSRIQVRGIADLRHPGTCALCGASDSRRRYVDPSIFFDYEGQMYFCDFCMKEMAQAIGCLSPEDAAFLQNVNETLATRNVELEKVKIAYDRLIVALRDAGTDYPSSDTLLNPGNETHERQPGKSTESELTSDQPTISRTEQVTESLKSTAKRESFNDASRITGTDSTDGDDKPKSFGL